MKKVIVTTLFFACIASFAAPAMTLKDAIALALKNQQNVLRGEQSLAAAKYRLTQSKSDYFPQLNVDYTQGIFNSTQSKASGNAALNASMNFYDGGKRELNVKSSELGIDSSTSNLEQFKQAVVNNVTSAYFTLLKAKKQNDVVKSQLKLLNGQLDLIKARIEVGDAAAVDSLPVEASAANARFDLLTSNNNIRTSAMLLQNAIGIAITPDFDIDDFNLKQITVDSLENYITVAKANRPEILISKAGVESAKVNVDIAKLQTRIRPQVNGTWSEPLIGSGKSNYSVTAGVVYSIFDAGANKAALNVANTNLESAKIQQNQANKDIESDVQIAYINVLNSVEKIAASAQSLKSAQASYDAQEERYKLGLVTPLDLLNAQNTLVSAQYNAVQANYDYYINISKLEYATGKQGVLYGN
ncbi:MAG: TolC family protein [bacterium]